MAIIYELGFINYLWVVWFVSILFSIEYLRSILKYRYPQIGTFSHHTAFIIFQITTKGGESSAEYTIRKVRMACENIKLDKYRIDVVTDSHSDCFYNANMVYVPPEY